MSVSHPRTRAARPGRRDAAVRDVHEQTPLGEVYMKALMRTQLRLGLLVCAAVCLPLAALPLLLGRVPVPHWARPWGAGLPWLVLGPPVYALLVAAGICYVRRAERNERDFDEHVRRS
ncbi:MULTISPECIES: hypothetical protein [Streptomyces]|uniref:Uncharacterized protein n=1 Tax=Streptomyces murinus TaxID=33900 RepID=A0A7W3NVE6_STRMR|nr:MULTISPECIES: hypothetical protein [Streptomyces]MBA9057458.1 hypothetical protein [Streptomyces murinus]NDK23415.1 hypothetical protein [Streptomyces sp. TR1341]WSI89044.1 hypothetical protein OG516_33045 [Streptomyces murinus]